MWYEYLLFIIGIIILLFLGHLLYEHFSISKSVIIKKPAKPNQEIEKYKRIISAITTAASTKHDTRHYTIDYSRMKRDIDIYFEMELQKKRI